MSRVGFIGTGTMGGPIAHRMFERCPGLRVFDIDENALRSLADLGAIVAPSVRDIAASCDTVFLSLPGPAQIEDVVLGEDGLLTTSESLRTIVDLSTNSVNLNRDISRRASAKGIDYLDAPVSGGKLAARDGSLAVMIGGDEDAFIRVRPLLEYFGAHIHYMGIAGCGTLAKLINNQIFLAVSVLIQEGFVLGAKAGLDPNALLEALKECSAGPLLAAAPLILSGKFDVGVFALSIAAKDLDVALACARDLDVAVPVSSAAYGIYESALAAGDEDFFATVKVLEAAAGLKLPPLRGKKKL